MTASMQRTLVVGIGSIGRRHIDNLLALGASVAAYSHRGGTGVAELPSGVVPEPDLDTALARGYDAVVIANRTDQHLPTALRAGASRAALFIEKPISNSLLGIRELRDMVDHGQRVVEVGYMLRFHPNLLWIKGYLERGGLGQIQYARALVGQHLAAWRVGTDHRRSYSADRKAGGGVVFDLIHELDLLTWLLGDVTDVTAFLRHEPTLEIETEAIAQVSLRFATGALAQVSLDYVRPTYARNLEIVGTAGVLHWDYVSGTVRLERPDRDDEVVHVVPEGFVRNSMFLGQMSRFLARVRDPRLPAGASLDDGIRSLRIALACHRSAEGASIERPGLIPEDYVPTGTST